MDGDKKEEKDYWFPNTPSNKSSLFLTIIAILDEIVITGLIIVGIYYLYRLLSSF